jgi:hypothetical protein
METIKALYQEAKNEFRARKAAVITKLTDWKKDREERLKALREQHFFRARMNAAAAPRLPLGRVSADRQYDLHCRMMAINPRGWRIPGKKRGITKPPEKRNMLRKLAEAAVRA